MKKTDRQKEKIRHNTKRKNTDGLKEKKTANKKKQKTDKKKKKQIIKGQTVQRDHGGKIFASLYTIIKTKWAISFNQGKINTIMEFSCYSQKFQCQTNSFHVSPTDIFS